MVLAVAGRVIDDAADVDQLSGSNRPADLPTCCIEHFATRVNSDSSLPVVADAGESHMLQAVEGEEIVHTIGENEAAWEVLEDLGYSLLLLLREALTGRIVRCIQYQHACLLS